MLLDEDPAANNLKPLQDHSSTTSSRYRTRSRSRVRTPNETAQGSEAITAATTPVAPASEQSSITSGTEQPAPSRKRGRPRKNPINEQQHPPQTPHQANKNGANGQPQRSSSRIRSAGETRGELAGPPERLGPVLLALSNDQDTLFDAMELFTACSDSELLSQERTFPPRLKDAFHAFTQGRIGTNPKRLSRLEDSHWTSWVKENWEVISTGALALQGKTIPDGTNVQNRLSNRDGTYTAADDAEMAEFIGKQIRARKLADGGETTVMMQDFFWKAFVIVYKKTDRDWGKWQTYYRKKADAINRAARERPKPEDPSVAQVVAEMEQLVASGRYDTPPTTGSLKRPLEGSSDERHSKQLRS
ncbi:hypothetical protein FRC01_012865 [Tulasnella sp. 417]|nr:hypothetical protein FRC01_012865 [Tulasnella sp. 417]